MAQATINTGAWTQAIKYWCYSINSALAANWPPAEPRWEWLLDCLGKFQSCDPAKDIAQIPENRNAIVQTLAAVREKSTTEPYRTLTAKLTKLLSPSPTQAT